MDRTAFSTALGALGLFLQRAADPAATQYAPEFWKDVIARARKACGGDKAFLRHLETIESRVDHIYGPGNSARRVRMLKAVDAMTALLESPPKKSSGKEKH